MVPGNHSSLELNERGPALNVFWSRYGGMGAGLMNARASQTGTRGVIERLTKKTEPEGAGPEVIQSAPFGSKS